MAGIATAPGAVAPRTTTDFTALAQLRARAADDAAAATPEAARQFEALFVQMMLQSMRAASDVFGDGSDTTYRDMFDQQIALEMTRGKGLGLAALMTRQLAPAGANGTDVRDPGARDFVAARQTAPPSPPTARLRISGPDDASLAAAATLPSLALGAAEAGGQSGWQDWRPQSPEEFMRGVWPHAEAAGRVLGVDPRAIVAQAALETGWGRNVARDGGGVSGNNLFNIKADASWTGDRLAVRTLEFADGLPKQQVAAFRAYPDLESAFADYVSFLKGNPRYAAALESGARAENFADKLQAAGYATDPSYADKLRSILASPRFNDMVGRLKNLVRMPKL